MEANFEAERPSGETESAEGAEGSTGRAARRRRPEEHGNFEAERPSGETESAEGAEGSTGRAARRRRPEELGSSSLAIEALADPTRRAILERLRGGPMPVKDIASGLPVTRPAVSQHLGVLKRAGLVSEQRQGTFRLYRLESQGLHALRAYLDNFWSAALSQFAEAAARNQGRKP